MQTLDELGTEEVQRFTRCSGQAQDQGPWKRICCVLLLWFGFTVATAAAVACLLSMYTTQTTCASRRGMETHRLRQSLYSSTHLLTATGRRLRGLTKLQRRHATAPAWCRSARCGVDCLRRRCMCVCVVHSSRIRSKHDSCKRSRLSRLLASLRSRSSGRSYSPVAANHRQMSLQ